MKVAEKESYIDVTSIWINNAKPNSHKVKDKMYYKHNGVIYKVDNKYVVLDYSKKEREIAEWLENTFGGEIYMLPRINYPKEISTADYLFNGEKFDLKEINGNGKRILDNILKSKKKQANNFIIDISKSKIEIESIKYQINKIYNDTKRTWINIIILIKNNELIKIYKRK